MVIDYNNELLGFWERLGLGLTFKEKILNFIKKRTRGLSIYLYSTFGNVDNLDREYLALQREGWRPVEFIGNIADIDRAQWSADSWQLIFELQKRTKLPQRIIDLYLRALWYGAHLGKIPYSKWNPKGYEERQALKQSWSTEKTWLAKAGEFTGKKTKNIILLATIAGGGFLLYQFMETKKRK
jgi:hypothetical protein